MNRWIRKWLVTIGGLLCEPTLLMLLIWCGMATVVSAGPLLSTGNPFEQTELPARATMLIEVQEYTAPPPEAMPVVLKEELQESPPAPKEEASPQQPEASAIPEPSSLLLVGVGALTVLWFKRRTRR